MRGDLTFSFDGACSLTFAARRAKGARIDRTRINQLFSRSFFVDFFKVLP